MRRDARRAFLRAFLLVAGTALLATAARAGLAPLPADALFAKREAWTPRLREETAERLKGLRWTLLPGKADLTPAMLDRSIELAVRFLRNTQRPEGNFYYEYDFLKRRMSQSDNEVRQAGALWSLSRLCAWRPTVESRRALDGGLRFFARCSQPVGDGAVAIIYPGSNHAKTGAVALVSLAIIEKLRSDRGLKPDRRKELTSRLEGYLNFLRRQQFPDGTFSESYFVLSRKSGFARSCYFDGESLLAFCKAARYLGYKELVPRIRVATATMTRRYILDPLRFWRVALETKQFYQWGAMAFWECVDAKWDFAGPCGDAALIMSWWTIHKRGLLDKRWNAGFAYEGLIPSWRIAVARGDRAAAESLRRFSLAGVRYLLTFQVGGPLAKENALLRLHPTRDPLAVGGCMNSLDSPKLRIDVTQHQLHAMILARRWMVGPGR